MSNKRSREKGMTARPVNPRDYTQQYAKKRGEKRQKPRSLMTAIRGSLAQKLQTPDSNQLIIYSRLDKLRDQIERLLLTKEPPTKCPLFVRRICEVVEQHLEALVVEFPDLYCVENRAKSKTEALESYLSRAAKIQQRDLNKCYALLDQFEGLIQSSARPLIERYSNNNSEAVADKRMNAVRHLRSILPAQYSAPNGRPVEQMKHVLAKQLEQIFLNHDLPIKQSSVNADSLAV
jgi:hypothetical protein